VLIIYEMNCFKTTEAVDKVFSDFTWF
jgi:hypothetical protein